MQNQITLICDRCRAHGVPGEDPFLAFGALLDFEPVPRRTARADGWDADVQRAFIAALSLTGTRRAACRAVGRSAFGVDQLLACPGSEGFRAAHDEALAIAASERSRRLAEGLRTVAAEQSGWRPADPPWAKAATRNPPAAAVERPPEPEPDKELEEKQQWIEGILRKYLYKVEAERKARLDGRVVEADFYLRQMTWIEVAIDLTSGGRGFEALSDFRLKGHHSIEIAETLFSKILGEVRRRQWEKMGDPPRPEHPPRRYLVDQGGFSTEPMEYTRGGISESYEEQRRVFEERHRQDAEEQIEWEAEARRDYDRRPESDAGS